MIRATLTLLALMVCSCSPPSGTQVECGPGTALQNGACTAFERQCAAGFYPGVGGVCAPLLTCGQGTVQQNDACVASVTCGANTQLSNGACVSTLSCGAGTHPQSGSCVADGSTVVCGAGTQLQNGMCTASVTCGPGTQLQNGQCIASVVCGAGTQLQNGQCVPNGATVSCGAGTVLRSGACIPDLSVVCGTDTTGAGGNRCVGVVVCGPGTMRSGASCVAQTSVTCGPGTTLQGGQCVIAPSTGPLTAFLASPLARATSTNLDYPGGRSVFFIATDLSQGNAEAWAATRAPMIGTGRALHFGGYVYGDLTTSGPHFFPIESSVTPGGACLTLLQPSRTPSNSGNFYLNLHSWSGGIATPASCASNGTLKIERLYNQTTARTQIRLTINAQFSDGSTIIDGIHWF